MCVGAGTRGVAERFSTPQVCAVHAKCSPRGSYTTSTLSSPLAAVGVYGRRFFTLVILAGFNTASSGAEKVRKNSTNHECASFAAISRQSPAGWYLPCGGSKGMTLYDVACCFCRFVCSRDMRSCHPRLATARPKRLVALSVCQAASFCSPNCTAKKTAVCNPNQSPHLQQLRPTLKKLPVKNMRLKKKQLKNMAVRTGA